MENQEKSLTLGGLTVPNSLMITIAIAMMGVSLYLTRHYYDVHFPVGLGAGPKSMCDISSFWNCDAATYSSFSNVGSVPISFFGLILGAVMLFGSVVPSRQTERTLFFLISANAIGCLILMIYSLVSLGSLCPMCSLYYVFSWIAFFLYWKYSDRQIAFDPKTLAIAGIPTLVGALILVNYYSTKIEGQTKVIDQLVAQYFTIPQVGDPKFESPSRLVSSTEKFGDAPLRVSIYSDFQCPFCKRVAKQFSKIERQFHGKLNFQYMYYPIDSECNDGVKRAFHPAACKASYVAICGGDKFKEIHDVIFENQEKLNHKWLNDLAKRYKIEACVNDPKTKEKVKAVLNSGKDFNVKGTPTFIVNGRKIDTALPDVQWIGLFKGILAKQGK